MENLNNMSDVELLSDFRHIETHLRKVKDDQTFLFGPVIGQLELIAEIMRLSRITKVGTDASLSLKRALTSFVK